MEVSTEVNIHANNIRTAGLRSWMFTSANNEYTVLNAQ